MLDPSQVKELEKKWIKYKIKFYLTYIAIVIFLLLAIPLAFMTYTYINKDATTLDLQQKNDSNFSKKPIIIPLLNATIKSDKNITQKNIVKNQIVKNTSKKNIHKQFPKKKIKTQKKEEVIDENFLQDELFEIIPYDENENIISQKPRINIVTSQLKGFATLKEKFYNTKNIIFALMIAEEYYHIKDYKNSLKWSLIANSMDAENERSWIIFAKSKAKNGQPKKAIDALSAYLKLYPNAEEIKTLIKKIKDGEN